MTKRKAINVPVTDDQEKEIKRKAKEKGMSVSAYLRYLALYSDIYSDLNRKDIAGGV